MAADSTVAALRAALLGILIFGSAGTLLELWLLEHTEDAWQRLPLVLLSAGLLALLARFVFPRPAAIRALQLAMLLCVASGVVGAWQHYTGNVEFELEMRSSLAGWELFRESMSGATPVLAPGAMIWLGLTGLAYAYRHPLTRRRR